MIATSATVTLDFRLPEIAVCGEVMEHIGCQDANLHGN